MMAIATPGLRSRSGRRALTAVCCGAAIGAAVALSLGRQQGYRPAAGDDRPPADTAYAAALNRGLKGDLAGARGAFEHLAEQRPQSSAGAWSLYQASLAAGASKDSAAVNALQAKLRRDYPGHPLTLRMAEAPSRAPVRKPQPDCGARSLLTLCREAGIPAKLPDLKRLCKTTEEGTTLAEIEKAARKKGFESAAAHVDGNFLEKHRRAGIAWVDGDHFVAFGPYSGQQAWLEDPSDDQRRPVTYSEIAARSQGMVLLCAWGETKLPKIR